MGRCLVKLTDGDSEWFLEWSSVVDAPVTYGMSREELRDYIKDEYGDRGLAGCDARGTSSLDSETADDVISFNRAGKEETCLTKEQIVEYYCRNRPGDDEPEREKPMGTRHHYDEG